MRLNIRKKDEGVFLHNLSDGNTFYVFEYAETNGNDFRIYTKNSSVAFLFSDISLFDDTLGGVEETFSSIELLVIRLSRLGYNGLSSTRVVVDNPMGFSIPEYDYIGLTSYDANGNLLITQYRKGGASGILTGTVTMTYDGSNRMISITKS